MGDEFDEEEVEALPKKDYPEFSSVRLSEIIKMDLGELKIQRVNPPTGKRRRSGGGDGDELLPVNSPKSDPEPTLPGLPEMNSSEKDPEFQIKRSESRSSFMEPGLDGGYHWQRHRDSIKVLKVFNTASAKTSYRTIVFVRSGKSLRLDQSRTGLINKIGAYARGFMAPEKTQPENQTQILDAPLSKKGIIQAQKFSTFMRLQKLENARKHVDNMRISLIEKLQDALLHLKDQDPEGEKFKQGQQKLRELMSDLKRLDENVLTGEQPPLRASFTLQEVYHTLLFDHDQCIITTSNSRRAIQTASIALGERFKYTEEDPSKDPLVVLSCLQEVVARTPAPSGIVEMQPNAYQNPDASPILSPAVVDCDIDADKMERDYELRIDNTYNSGDVSAVDRSVRINDYLNWVFEKNEKSTVVSFGHGRWFQEFFRETIPPQQKDEKDEDGDSKLSKQKRLVSDLRKKKLQDCAAVAFSLYKIVRPNGTEPIYSLPPQSLVLLYGQLKKA